MTAYHSIVKRIDDAQDERVLKKITFNIIYETKEKTITEEEKNKLIDLIDEKRELIHILEKTNKGT